MVVVVVRVEGVVSVKKALLEIGEIATPLLLLLLVMLLVLM